LLSSVASVSAGPPVTATFFKVVPSTNAIHRPSGEMNGPLGAPVNIATGSRRRARDEELRAAAAT